MNFASRRPYFERHGLLKDFSDVYVQTLGHLTYNLILHMQFGHFLQPSSLHMHAFLGSNKFHFKPFFKRNQVLFYLHHDLHLLLSHS